MTTDEELHRIESDRLQPDARVWATHFFSHFGSSEPERTAFRDDLRTNGFGTPGDFTEIGSDEEVSGDGNWHHWAFTVLEASPKQLRRADELARSIADAHSVRYDGWQVIRDQDTGAPKLAGDE